MIERVEKLRAFALEKLGAGKSLALLFGRLGVGLVFMSTGWGKVHSVEKVTAFFESLHIPAPGFHAVLVGWTELLCGTAIVLGVLTRLAAIPLVISMIVAILTAKRAELHGLFDLVTFDEFTYIVLLVMIAVLGPGALSVDRVLAKRFFSEDAEA
jgi:putative oxidoreductase